MYLYSRQSDRVEFSFQYIVICVKNPSGTVVSTINHAVISTPTHSSLVPSADEYKKPDNDNLSIVLRRELVSKYGVCDHPESKQTVPLQDQFVLQTIFPGLSQAYNKSA